MILLIAREWKHFGPTNFYLGVFFFLPSGSRRRRLRRPDDNLRRRHRHRLRRHRRHHRHHHLRRRRRERDLLSASSQRRGGGGKGTTYCRRSSTRAGRYNDGRLPEKKKMVNKKVCWAQKCFHSLAAGNNCVRCCLLDLSLWYVHIVWYLMTNDFINIHITIVCTI